MEFRIADIVEKFCTLQTYKQITDLKPVDEHSDCSMTELLLS